MGAWKKKRYQKCEAEMKDMEDKGYEEQGPKKKSCSRHGEIWTEQEAA